MAKITSVLELARYKVDETAYRVALIGNDTSKTYTPLHRHTWQEDGLDDCRRKQLTEVRQKIGKLPHLCYKDYSILIPFLTADLLVVECKICSVYRCNDTGEFWYIDETDVHMPELYLFDTVVAARRERNRIIKQVKKWIDKNG